MSLTPERAVILDWMTSSECYYSPLYFTKTAYAWGEGDLKHHAGPRKWQQEVMQEMEKYLREGMGLHKALSILPDYYRHAVASGRGPGKSALVGMLAHWFLSTRIGGSTWVAANGKPQLETKTFPEISKWVMRGENRDFFEMNSTTIRPSKWFGEFIESPEGLNKSTRYYYISGQLWSKENPDAFAGAHNYDGEMAIFDEASGIPDEIWPVQEGVFTENIIDRFWLAFSNPRVSQGAFFECFHKNKGLWRTTQIDSRSVEGISHSTFNNIIAQHGDDSDEARVEVYGQFPNSGEDQFISPYLVDEAQARPQYKDESAPIIIGVDPARSGLDSTVIAVRKGRDIVALKRYKGEDTMSVVGRVIEMINEWDPDLTVIDSGGLGAGVFDRLREQKYHVREVNFGWRSNNPTAYLNARAEIWQKMKEWLKTASLGGITQTDFASLKDDLCAPNKKMNSMGSLQLEGKKEMKARGAASPDCFVAGTLVQTPFGCVPIEQIVEGDLVCTPFGATPVVMTHEVDADSLTKVKFSDGSELIGKPAHRVFTFDQGWVRLDSLSLTNEIESRTLWNTLQWKFLTVLFTREKPFSFKRQVDTISRGGRTKRRDYFTDEFTSNILGRFLMGIMSITRMVTGLIIHRPISTVSTGLNMSGSTQDNSWQTPADERLQSTHYVRTPIKPPNGTVLQKDLSGIDSMESRVGKNGRAFRQTALSAENSMKPTSLVGVFSVLKRVKQTLHITGIKQWLERVLCAARRFTTTNIGFKTVVPVSVADCGGGVKTYNLTLLDDNAYYANGILVENCADAIAVTFHYDINTKAVSKKPMLDRMRSKGAKMTLIGAQGSGWMN